MTAKRRRNLLVPVELDRKLQARATKERRPWSHVVVMLLEEAVEATNNSARKKRA